jgi:hypothetical protein
MGHQIIKQPDGRLAVFSSVVDDWIITDATPAELEDYYAAEAAADARKKVQELCKAVLSGNARKAYYQFTMTFKEACARARDHGDDGEG